MAYSYTSGPTKFGWMDKISKFDGIAADFLGARLLIVPHVIHYAFSRRLAGAWRFQTLTAGFIGL
jgi:hypothetical protein